VVFSRATSDFMKEGVLRETPPAPPKENKYKSTKLETSIEEKRAALEMKKLDLELQKLEQPDTRVDYYDKMLELQKTHFTQLLAMQSEQGNLKLEIEKLKLLGSDDGDAFTPMLQQLLPMLPQLLAKKADTPTFPMEKPITQEEVNQKMVKLETAADLETYKKAIQAGEVTEQEGWEDFLESIPNAEKLLTREQFNEHFKRVKEGK